MRKSFYFTVNRGMVVQIKSTRHLCRLALLPILVSCLVSLGLVASPSGTANAATAYSSGYGTAYCPSTYKATSGSYRLPSNYYGTTSRTIYRITSAGIVYGNRYRATATKTVGYKSGSVWRYSTYSYYPRVYVSCYKLIVLSRSGSGVAYCPSGTRASSGSYKLPGNYYGSFSSTEYQIRSYGIRYGTQYYATAVKINGSYSSSYGWRYSTFSYSPSVTVRCVG